MLVKAFKRSEILPGHSFVTDPSNFGDKLLALRLKGKKLQHASTLTGDVDTCDADTVVYVLEETNAVTQSMLLVYDIPEDADMDNPSSEFRQFAFRINLSCWIIQRGDMSLASHTLNRIREVGGIWHSLPFADEGSDIIIGLAAHSIQKEIREHLHRANVSHGRLVINLNEAEDRDAAIRFFRNRAGGITRRLNFLLRDMRLLSRRWGLNSAQVGLLPAMSSVAALQGRMYKQVADYARATEALKHANHPLASAASAGQVPIGVIADAMDDAEMVDTEGNPLSAGLRDEEI